MSDSSTTLVQQVPTATLQITGGTLGDVLLILQTALNVLGAIPATAAGAALASLATQIIIAAVNRIHAQTGKPIDLSTIPVEVPLP